VNCNGPLGRLDFQLFFGQKAECFSILLSVSHDAAAQTGSHVLGCAVLRSGDATSVFPAAPAPSAAARAREDGSSLPPRWGRAGGSRPPPPERTEGAESRPNMGPSEGGRRRLTGHSWSEPLRCRCAFPRPSEQSAAVKRRQQQPEQSGPSTPTATRRWDHGCWGTRTDMRVCVFLFIPARPPSLRSLPSASPARDRQRDSPNSSSSPAPQQHTQHIHSSMSQSHMKSLIAAAQRAGSGAGGGGARGSNNGAYGASTAAVSAAQQRLSPPINFG
jgi:hypothetical protein